MVRKVFLYILFIGSFAFLTNFLWESLHAVYLYRNHDISSTVHVLMLLAMLLKNSLIILGGIFFIALLNRSFAWLEDCTKANLVGFSALLLLTAAAIELISVKRLSHWNSLERMQPSSASVSRHCCSWP